MIMFSTFVQFTVVAVALLSDGIESQTTTTPAPCVDTITDCHFHRREDICQGIYKPWATARCSRYCGFCTGPGTEEPCVDTIPNCNEYLPCNNPSYFVWVEGHCRKYCHHCGSTSGTTVHAMTAQSTPKSVSTASTPTSSAGGHTLTATVQQTEPSRHPTATAAATTGRVSPSCTDQLGWCHRYSITACQNQQWGRTYCANYCNLCPEVTSSVPKTTLSGAVTSNSVTTTARSTGSPSPSCSDKLPFCSRYSKEACEDQQWGRTYCPNFCNLCSA